MLIGVLVALSTGCMYNTTYDFWLCLSRNLLLTNGCNSISKWYIYLMAEEQDMKGYLTMR